MKNLFYTLYALFFNLSRMLFPLKDNRVAFVSMHNENFCDALGAVRDELETRGGYDFVYITRQDLSLRNPFKALGFFLFKSRLLATAKYVFLNDNFLPMGKLTFRKEAVITQLWHAEGAFKKFGLHIEQNDSLRKAEKAANSKLTYVVCSSEGVRKIYAEAFGVDEKKVLPLGSPRTDYLCNENNRTKAIEEIHEKYPRTKGKKILLYAPTFRDEEERDKEILSNFDVKAVKKELGEEYEIFIRLHPQIHISEREPLGAVDVTDFSDVRKLILACDVLVTDYSSICMDFSFLSKKTVFFAYDLEWYTERRDFYFDYESFVPGLVAKNTAELISGVNADFPSERNARFKTFNFDFFDGKSAKRVVDEIVIKNKRYP